MLALSVAPELQAEKLELWEQNSLGLVESQELNEKHMRKLLFKEPPTELHS